jgi:hypothetical protein
MDCRRDRTCPRFVCPRTMPSLSNFELIVRSTFPASTIDTYFAMNGSRVSFRISLLTRMHRYRLRSNGHVSLRPHRSLARRLPCWLLRRRCDGGRRGWIGPGLETDRMRGFRGGSFLQRTRRSTPGRWLGFSIAPGWATSGSVQLDAARPCVTPAIRRRFGPRLNYGARSLNGHPRRARGWSTSSRRSGCEARSEAAVGPRASQAHRGAA